MRFAGVACGSTAACAAGHKRGSHSQATARRRCWRRCWLFSRTTLGPTSSNADQRSKFRCKRVPMRSSVALDLKRSAVREAVGRFHTANPRVFGSVLHATDHEGSDLDLLVDVLPGATLLDLGDLQEELKSLPGVEVDLLTPGICRPSSAPRCSLRRGRYERKPIARLPRSQAAACITTSADWLRSAWRAASDMSVLDRSRMGCRAFCRASSGLCRASWVAESGNWTNRSRESCE